MADGRFPTFEELRSRAKNLLSRQKEPEPDLAPNTYVGTTIQHIKPDGIAQSYGHEPHDIKLDHYLYIAEPGKVIDGNALVDRLFENVAPSYPFQNDKWARQSTMEECDGAKAVLVTRTYHGIHFKSINDDTISRILNDSESHDELAKFPLLFEPRVIIFSLDRKDLDSIFIQRDETSPKKNISPVNESKADMTTPEKPGISL